MKYPNLYILIEGGPGLGKTQIALTVKNYLKQLNHPSLQTIDRQEGKKRASNADVVIVTKQRKPK